VAKSRKSDPRPDPDALAVERLLRQLQHGSGGAVAPPAPPGPAPPQRRAPARPANQATPMPVSLSLPSIPGVWVRIALGVLLGAAMTQWPYAGTCGAGLGLKVAATAMVALAGIWAAAQSWRRRMATAHMTALLVIAWGLALLTHEILPRTPYWSDPAPWLCPPAKRAFHAPPPGAAQVARPDAFGHPGVRV
jgi:hypothetical protein